jgi:hypothetical protein
LTFCQELINQEGFSLLKNQIEESVGYLMTPFRIADLIMYSNGGR